jgi:2-iminobutanoate/2-iminopropanoate deaminase
LLYTPLPALRSHGSIPGPLRCARFKRQEIAKETAVTKREVVQVPGVSKHKNPIPNCIKMGNMVFSASIAGNDPATQKVPADAATQIANAFVNLRQTIEAAGGTTGNIARINFYVPDMAQREHINREWLKMFPDENDRPVRKVFPTEIPAGLFLQLDFIGVL